jgi:uncharacterized protein YdeI (YjbR/CyaY-like superfamily)
LNTLYVTTSEQWREWLEANYNKVQELWLIFYKKDSGVPSLGYETAVEDALCYGWIDSIIKKINDQKYARKFTPRNEDSKWSDLNKKRVENVIKDGRMTEIGMAKIEAAKSNGSWDKVDRPDINLEMPSEFKLALNKNKKAQENFNHFARTYQKPFIIWISMAKRDETRQKRIAESIKLLEKGEKLGLK